MIVVLVIVHDLNNLGWSSKKVSTEIYDMDVEVYERVYDVIGIPRYYPEELFDKNALPKEIKEYRIGFFSGS